MNELAAVLTILRAPVGEAVAHLSRVLAQVVPHEGLALLTGDCALLSPLLTHGLDGVSAGEVGRLAGQVQVGTPWYGEAVLAGTPRHVLAVAAQPPETTGGLLVIPVERRPHARVLEVVQQLVEVTIIHLADRISAIEPVRSTAPPPDALSDQADAHAATLTALLGVLRSRQLDDAAARRTAIELAVPALLEVRDGEHDRGEEGAADAFAILAEKLSLLTRYNEVSLDLVPPAVERPLPGEVARGARALTRGALLAMLQQGRVSRIRVEWQLLEAELRVSVRDDGPGAIASDALSVHRLHGRLSGLGGTVAIDSVPGWGTTIGAAIPLSGGAARATIGALNPREQDVLDQLARGSRNRAIAERLGISENTVKFHVANIFGKLGVSSRGEAAALARELAGR